MARAKSPNLPALEAGSPVLGCLYPTAKALGPGLPKLPEESPPYQKQKFLKLKDFIQLF
jgi:hypothetical protein